MNKTFMIFMAGLLSGTVFSLILLATGVLQSSSPIKMQTAEKRSNIEPQPGTTENNAQLASLNEINTSLSNITTRLQQTVETLTSVSALMAAGNGSAGGNTADYTVTKQVVPLPAIRQGSFAPGRVQAEAPAQPSPQQVDQYYYIQNRLYEAANDPSIALADLIQEAESLTREQRHSLTEDAMGMLERGELTTDQFTASGY